MRCLGNWSKGNDSQFQTQIWVMKSEVWFRTFLRIDVIEFLKTIAQGLSILIYVLKEISGPNKPDDYVFLHFSFSSNVNVVVFLFWFAHRY